MQIIVELILQIFGELLIQLVCQLIAAFLMHVSGPFRSSKVVPPSLAVIGYFFFGAIAGVLSLLLSPKLFITRGWLRFVNLIITPTIVGLLMARIGLWCRKHERAVIRLDSFSYGFCFAFSMALVRLLEGY